MAKFEHTLFAISVAVFYFTAGAKAQCPYPPCPTFPVDSAQSGDPTSVTSDSGVRLVATPGIIEKDITDLLEIQCRYTGSESVVSIGIGKRTNGNMTGLMYIVSSQPNVIIKPDAQLQADVSGTIDSISRQAHVTIKWRKPTADQQGDYVCLVSEILRFGWVRHRESTVHVRAVGVTEHRLLQRLERLEANLGQLEARQAQQDLSLAVFQEALFSVSGSYKNHSYHLTEYLPVSYGKAEAVCGALGGYIAEIDDRAEYDFIVNFLSPRMTTPTIVLIAGSDEKHARQWVFQRTNKPVEFLDWWAGEPNGIGVEHRLSLMINRSGPGSGIHMNNMYSHSVPQLSTYYQYGFLCEVP